jgi:hypothetical protein
MLWCFERSHEELRVETRYDNETAEFVTVVRHPDGRELTHRFANNADFRTWLEAFQRELQDGDWQLQGGGPIFLPYGWRDDHM